MKLKLLDILKCPECGSEIYLKVLKIAATDPCTNKKERKPLSSQLCDSIKVTKETFRRFRCYDTVEIEIGILQCTRKTHCYPVVNCIPRMLSTSLYYYGDVIRTYGEKIPPEVHDMLDNRLLSKNKSDNEKAFDHIQKSFTEEWAYFKGTEMAWGRDIATRYKMFYSCLDLPPSKLSRKKILDAGCGHGEIEFALLDSGAEIYAVDISFSVDDLQDRLWGTKDKYLSNIHIIQGNVHKLPFRKKLFDIIYCDGVLHHTPDTFKGFKSITKTLKLGGISARF